MRENKNYRFVPFLPNGFIENSKIYEKNYKNKKNTLMASLKAKID